MKHYAKLKGGIEYDAFSKYARRVVGFKAESLSSIKHGYRQRERAVLKRELLELVGEWAIESSMK